MGKLCEAVSVLFSIFSFLISISCVITSLLTEYWVYATITNDRDLPEGKSYVSSGLFSGVREVDWGLGSKTVVFHVLSELHTGSSFFSRIPWILLIFFAALGVFWAIVGITTGVVSLFAKTEDTIAGELGIVIWSILASLSLAAASIIFLVQFHSTLKVNLLLPEQLLGGFSTAGRASFQSAADPIVALLPITLGEIATDPICPTLNCINIGYSFYLIVAAIGVLQTPPLFILLSKSCKKEPLVVKQPSFYPTALLY